jgi:pre-mRNA-splicing factor 18
VSNPAASTASGKVFVRRGDVASITTTTTNDDEQPAAVISRKRQREAVTKSGISGISAAEVARQQRIVILRQKAAEASAAALAASEAEAEATAQKVLAAAAVAKRTAQGKKLSSSSSSSSSTSSSSTSSSAPVTGSGTTASTKSTREEPLPREESALELEDGKKAGKNLRRVFKMYLDEWSQELRERDDQEKRTAAGRAESKRFKECKDNIRPLFKLSRTQQLASDLRIAIRRIAHYCYCGEYVKAHDEYIGIAIGNAAWPIGVTMVGIHARAGRQSIQSNKIAHAMDDEMTLKYLTSIKRLISYAQRRHPSAPSKMVLM